MTLSELKRLLLENNVPERWYSIDDGLKQDACVLYKNYSVWEFFYLDERGGRNDFRVFDNDSEAYTHLWEKMEYQLKFFTK